MHHRVSAQPSQSPDACLFMAVALLAFGLAQCVDLSSMAFMVLEAACELDVRSGMWRGSQV